MRTCECFASQQLCTQWWKCLDQLLHLVVAKWYFPSKIFSWRSSIKKRFPCTLHHPFFFENPYELGFFFIHWLHLILFDIQILLDLASGSPFTYQFYRVCWLVCPFDISQSFWVSEPIGEKYGLSWLGYCSRSTELAKVSPKPHRVFGRSLDTWRKKKSGFFYEDGRVRDGGFKVGWPSTAHQ